MGSRKSPLASRGSVVGRGGPSDQKLRSPSPLLQVGSQLAQSNSQPLLRAPALQAKLRSASPSLSPALGKPRSASPLHSPLSEAKLRSSVPSHSPTLLRGS